MTIYRFVIILLVSIGCTGSLAFAGDDGWRILSIEGDVHLKHGDQKQKISNATHLLAPVESGTTFVTTGNGRIVIVSMAGNPSYEILANSEALIETNSLVAIKGEVLTSTGYAVPKGVSGRIGGVVMRGTGSSDQCIHAQSLENTKILKTSPVLKWNHECDGLDWAEVSLISGKKIIFTTESTGEPISFPPELIKPATRYMWLIDGGDDFVLASSSFSTMSTNDQVEIEKHLDAQNEKDDVASRVSLIFYFIDKGLHDMANQKTLELIEEYPNSEGLKEVLIDASSQSRGIRG